MSNGPRGLPGCLCGYGAVWARVVAAASPLIACGGTTSLGHGGDGNSADGASPGNPSADGSTLPTNHALHFDGVDDYASSGTAQFPAGTAPQAISLWVQYSGVVGRQAFVALRNDVGGGIELGLRDGTIAAWKVYGDRVLTSVPSPPIGVWHHVAYVFDGALNTLYVDGTPGGSVGGSPNVNTYVSSWFGSTDGLSQFFAGDIDEIRIWRVARTSAQVLQEMSGQLAAQEPGLVAYFNCDTAVGTRVPDNSGNGNDATLGGGDPGRMPTLVPSTVPPGH